jgi:hypothetical protein
MMHRLILKKKKNRVDNMLSTPIEKKKNQGPNRTALPFPGSTTPDLCFFFL